MIVTTIVTVTEIASLTVDHIAMINAVNHPEITKIAIDLENVIAKTKTVDDIEMNVIDTEINIEMTNVSVQSQKLY